MKILITGAAGFVGKNLTAALENIRDGKDRVHKIKGLDKPSDLVIYKYDISSSPEDLDTYCREADFVFNLAGVNRPKDPEEFMKGNFGFGSKLLETDFKKIRQQGACHAVQQHPGESGGPLCRQ